MVGSKRSSKGRGIPKKPLPSTSPLTSSLLGYTSPPTLIGRETMDPSILALHEKNNAATYASKTWSRPDWNTYAAFGIQEYHSITECFTERKKASPEGKNLRLARYYRLHLENQAPVPRFLMGIILEVEQALEITHPGFFDMTLVDIDRYLVDWKTS
jgi:hypothetical protein